MGNDQLKIDLVGDLFYVDTVKNGLVNSLTPFNVIGFSQMEKVAAKANFPKSLRFLYDQGRKEIFSLEGVRGKLPPEVKYLEILQDLQSDPMDLLKKLGMPSSFMDDKGKSKVEIYHAALSIPRVNIFGTEYHADTRHLTFQEVLNPANKIAFKHIRVGRDKMFLDYHLDKKNVSGKQDAGDQDRIELVVLPLLKEIDPVGWDRWQGSDRGYLTYGQRRPSHSINPDPPNKGLKM